MTCPDLASLGRVGTTRADPAVVEHLHKCRSCWLDWQIQQGARYLLQDDLVVRGPSRNLNRLVIARITAMERHLEKPAGWLQLAASALLVAIAVLVFLLVRTDVVGSVAIGRVAALVVGGGLLGTLYFWKSDQEASRPNSQGVSRDTPRARH